MIYTAPCKINIGLDVLRRRPDGYHDIETAMVAVPDLCDAVEVLERPEGVVELSCGGLTVDCPPEDNLVLRAYRAVVERYGIGGAFIHLHKSVPFGAGLGGGSSDAMTVIRALSDCYGLGLSCQTMADIGASIGSDTPFFAYDTPMICGGRGEIMTPAPWLSDRLRGLHLTVVKPPVGVSTAEAYAGIAPSVPRCGLSERLSLPLERWRECVDNDFENSVFAMLPSLGEIKRSLYDAGAVYASMSGSGSALYALSRSRLDAGFDDCFVHRTVL
ncbi:MAG: 4-(cytidine 5'-diphospho)-2-C-methyl-D-erythritol kinase [Rikenellaceae bacterium]|nr:4-(cytidine 5'-diphospho)-2-C-methyl-D-erythritol kinase [Rikenellaceae bacterium]